MQQPLVLMVLDGWGERADGSDNAIARAPAVHFSRLWEAYPHTTLNAGGEAVGLLPGQMGDSNVGHLTLGAGRVIFQDLARIHRAVADGSFGRLPLLQEFLAGVRPGRLHLLGLLSPGGVHSHQEHLAAVLQAAREAGLQGDEVVIHVWTDGRDVPPGSAPASLAYLQEVMARTGVGRIATVSGRYFAMDRDRRWDRTERAYRAMVEGQGETAPDAESAVEAAYAAGHTDEFIPPTVLTGGGPGPFIREEDSVFVYNFRADRVRQIIRALADPEFDAFPRPFARVRRFLGMTQYDRGFLLPYL
ncbi:MAG: 2,3-bisphosphoglycerate-independent phosphoglycerate mutase, partial [Firmicutes bacterium]|nr:2,3-bisphosphoglycerate-independent phosphoglycerate mutase [Bacillota bacterium]